MTTETDDVPGGANPGDDEHAYPPDLQSAAPTGYVAPAPTSEGAFTYWTRDEWAPHVCEYPYRPLGAMSVVILHHQAGSVKTDEGQTVRDIEAYGWARDGARVEYNGLVGPYTGEPYIGYGINRAAHAAANGWDQGKRGTPDGRAWNYWSYGLCAMGDWSATEPPNETLEGIVKMLVGLAYNHCLSPSWDLIGHRDVDYTACPGDPLYAHLDALKREADRIIAGGFTPAPQPPEDDEMPLPAPPLIEATGADGTMPGAVYATDGRFTAIRWLNSWEYQDAQYWLRAAGMDDTPVRVDRIYSFGALVGAPPS